MTVQQPSLRRLVISSSMLCCQPAASMDARASLQELGMTSLFTVEVASMAAAVKATCRARTID